MTRQGESPSLRIPERRQGQHPGPVHGILNSQQGLQLTGHSRLGINGVNAKFPDVPTDTRWNMKQPTLPTSRQREGRVLAEGDHQGEDTLSRMHGPSGQHATETSEALSVVKPESRGVLPPLLPPKRAHQSIHRRTTVTGRQRARYIGA